MKTRKLKRAVIHEEYVAITGDFRKALILGQLLYWTDRVYDIDNFIQEENERRKEIGHCEELNIEPQHGWIYKSAAQLSEELMINASERSMRRWLSELVDAGLLNQRNNPTKKWDRTLQYRVNLEALNSALSEAGYQPKELTGNGNQKAQPLEITQPAKMQVRSGRKAGSIRQKSRFDPAEKQVRSGGKAGAIPETTSDTYSETTSDTCEEVLVNGWRKARSAILEKIDSIPADLEDYVKSAIKRNGVEHTVAWIKNVNNRENIRNYKSYLNTVISNNENPQKMPGGEPGEKSKKIQANKPADIQLMGEAAEILQKCGEKAFFKFCEKNGIGDDDIKRIQARSSKDQTCMNGLIAGIGKKMEGR